MKRISFGILLSAATMAMSSVYAHADAIGTMTALQTVVERSNGPALGVGAEIFLNDRLKSNNTGLGMIVFADESSAKIGPNASLTIDEFVYDPATRRGTLTVRADSGLTRFYGGQISKRGRMNARTPHMVLGVRGGIVEVNVEQSQSTGILRAGQMTCRLGEIVEIVTKPGFSCMSDGTQLVVGPGGQNSFPVLDSIDDVAGTGTPGQPGPGLDADGACISDAGSQLAQCSSRDGSIPGTDPGNNPGIPEFPVGGQKLPPVFEDF